MCFIKGSTNRKKGITLIELIISLSLLVIIISLLISSFNILSKTYTQVSTYAEGTISINEALMFISNKIENNCYKVESDNGVLKLYEKNSSYVDKVKKSGETLQFIYQSSYNEFTTNTLLYDIQSFTLTKINNVIFVKIIGKDGTVGEKCFAKEL